MKQIDISDLIGVKFVYNGRNAATGFDCYGLAIEVAKRFGHKLADVKYEKGGIQTFADNYEAVLAMLSESVKKTEKREAGNPVVFFSKGRAVHIGILLDEENFIHADIGGVRVENLDNYYRKEWSVFEWLK